MDLRFSEFTRKKDTLLEFFFIMESCLSRGMTIDSFARLAVKPVFESLNFTSEQEFINQIRRKVSLFNEDAAAAPATPTQVPAAGAKSAQTNKPAPMTAADYQKNYGDFLEKTKTGMKDAIKKQLEAMLKNLSAAVGKKKYQDRNHSLIAINVGNHILNALIKNLAAYEPKINFKTPGAAPAAQAPAPAGQQQAAGAAPAANTAPAPQA
jgi:hypothetical protein